MVVRYSAQDHERIHLEECLKLLSRGRGVWRDDDDLLGLLRGDLDELCQRWNLNPDGDVNAARTKISTTLTGYIEALYPRWGARRLTETSDVDRYRKIAKVGFNIDDESRELHLMILKERWDWLDEENRLVRVPERTSRRKFDEAVKRIAEGMVAGAQTAAYLGADTVASGGLNPDVGLTASGLKRMELSPHGLIAHLLVLSGEVRQALEAVRGTCRKRNRPFYTSDTLLALLDMSNGHVRDCFNGDGATDWAQHLKEKIAGQAVDAREGFVEFEWIERDEFQLALRYATNDQAPVVNEFHLLLAIFDGGSETNRRLERFLEQDYAKVRAAAERGRGGGGTPIKTPMWD